MRNACFLAAVLACGTAPLAAQTTAPAFTAYYSIGDSLAAGFESGSLVATHQVVSAPALIARQAGVTDFQLPLVSEPGIPIELFLQSLSPAPLIVPKSNRTGAPQNLGLGRAYNNMAVPGATVLDSGTRATDNGGLHDLILRGRGTQVAQVVAARPSVITLWIGNNDVLGAAVRGRAVDGETLTPAAAFRDYYTGVVATLRNTGARIFAANLPDVTSIPYVTTIPPVVVNPTTGQPVLANNQPVPLIGPAGPLPSGSLVTLGASSLLAQGIGIPTALGGRGTPLPDEVVIDPTELAIIKDRVAVNNQAIATICQAANIPVLDINGIMRDLAQNGRTIGGITFTGAYLTGGIFSYDGVHPTDLGYAITANEWIRLLNANGAALPEVDLLPFVGLATNVSASSRGRVPHTAWEFPQETQDSLLAIFPRLDER
ncbi:MAG: SGNH/GDSL hydrolase family protein [Vicinamibacteria bacterium]